MRRSIVSLFLFVLGISAAPSTTNKDSRPTVPLTKKSNIVKDGIVDIDTLKNHVTSLKYKYADSISKFEKNTGRAHPIDRDATAVKRQTGSEPLQDFFDELWYGRITVGGQDFTVGFDTGHSNFFLPGPNCDVSCKGHTIFDTSNAKDTGSIFQVHYGAGTISGEVYTDSVSVAGLTAKTQALGVANEYSSDLGFPNFPIDGIMGMAYPSLAEINATLPFFNTLIQEKSVSSGAFGFKLASSGSVLYLGGVDPSSSSGPLNTLPVDTQRGYWQVSMDSVDVGGSPVVSSRSAIIDTGVTFITGDDVSVSQFYKSIPGAQYDVFEEVYKFPCDLNPRVSITFGGISYDISSTFNLGSSNNPGMCVGGIVEGPSSFDTTWIVGDVFLRNVYAEFSFDNNTVGFSLQA